MPLERAYIPYGGYWSTPFCRWQGAVGHLHSLELAAETARAALAARDISPDQLDALALGVTVPQRHAFYGAPWLAGMLGAPALTGPTIAQACATSARLVATSALEVEAGLSAATLNIACDRTSNGPHVYFPDPTAPGATGQAEDPVLDNFGRDPHAGVAMVVTAENVAREAGITRAAQDDMAALRYAQYEASLADDRAFQRRYMVPVELKRRGDVVRTVNADEGVHPTTSEGLARLRSLQPEGTVTFGTQTHPADGNCGLLVCARARAAALSRDPAIEVQVLGFGSARVKEAFMPMAVVPAARQALAHAGVGLDACAAINTHNPFAVNDVYFCRETGVPAEALNCYGSPLVYGHPQAPTGLRAIIELIETLVVRGGGVGLFSGCAAGDTAMAVVIRVGQGP